MSETELKSSTSMSPIIRDAYMLRKLLEKSTGIKVYKAEVGSYSSFNLYRGIVQEYIAERTDVAGGYYEYISVISQKHALEAAEMVKQETKEKCQIAFRNFMLRATLANISGESLDFEKEFAETMSKI